MAASLECIELKWN